MKKLLITIAAIPFLLACNGNAGKDKNVDTLGVNKNVATTTLAEKPNTGDDKAQIAAAIHGFYQWYDVFQKDDKRNVNYIDESGKDRVLNEPMLDKFYADLKSSGYLSDEFITADKKLMKACAAVWVKEGKDGPPTCMDEDRFFCSQDWITDFYTKAPVVIQNQNDGKVTAMLTETKDGFTSTQKLDLKKENGRWLITKIYCFDSPE